MNEAGFANVPALGPGCRLTVVIPARDEASHITRTLAALARQRATDGGPLDARIFDILVFANSCSDATAKTVRAFAACHEDVTIHVVEAELPRDAAHIGTARKLVMDAAATRFIASGSARGIIASTDADTLADDTWIAWTLREAERVDAVAGSIKLDAEERSQFAPALQALYRDDAAYQQTIAELEAIYDPLPHDPLPRHAHHFGASFAVTADAYVRAGGIPPLPYLEDLALYRSLVRIDVHVRHSPHVRVTTSARRGARVAGGFATYLGDLDAYTRRGETLRVENPDRTLARIRARAALRGIYAGRFAANGRAAIVEAYADYDGTVAALDHGSPFGANVERIETRFDASVHAPVPLGAALATLRAVRAQQSTRTR